MKQQKIYLKFNTLNIISNDKWVIFVKVYNKILPISNYIELKDIRAIYHY